MPKAVTLGDLQSFIDRLILGGRFKMTSLEIEKEIAMVWGPSNYIMESKFKPLVKYGVITVDPVAVGVFKLIGSGKYLKPEIEQEEEQIDKLISNLED
jgi:hypothetical protein